MVALMCLFVGCAINATSVCAKAKQSNLEKKTANTKIGTHEIVLGKYDTLAKTGRPIYVKGKNAVKKKIGYARGGIYYTYNKNIVYVNKSYILCKTNILTKKTKKIMNCKKYTIADRFYNGKMILYSGDSLKTLNVKNNIITEIVKNP